jgi:hypothetical protein
MPALFSTCLWLHWPTQNDLPKEARLNCFSMIAGNIDRKIPHHDPVWLGNEACSLAHRTAAAHHAAGHPQISSVTWRNVAPRPNNIRRRAGIASDPPSQFTTICGP